MPVAFEISAATEPVAGRIPSALGPVVSGFAAMEARSRRDQPDAAGDPLEAVRARLAEHDVVGVALGEHVSDFVQCGREPGLADDVGAPAGPLLGQEARGGEGRRPDRVFVHLQPARREPRGEIPRRVERVVGEQQKAATGILEGLDEEIGARDQPLLPDEHAVHVDEVVVDRPVAHAQTVHRARSAPAAIALSMSPDGPRRARIKARPDLHSRTYTKGARMFARLREMLDRWLGTRKKQSPSG